MPNNDLTEAGASLKAVETDTRYWTPLERMHDAVHRARTKFLRDMVERVKGCAETFEDCLEELYKSGVDLPSDVPKAMRRAELHLFQYIAELEGAAERSSAGTP